MTPHHELRSVAVQCNLLAIPPLKKLGTISSEPDTESVPSDPDDDATDLDTSFHITQAGPMTFQQSKCKCSHHHE